MRRRPRRILRATQKALFTVAGVLLGVWLFVTAGALIHQRQESRRFTAADRESRPAAPEKSSSAPAVRVEGPVGHIEIPRLGVSVMVDEGIEENTLRKAVGHIPGTALPGEDGNVGIAGHRDTFFRPLRNIRKNDRIRLTTATAEREYRVVSTKIVPPEDVSVLDPTAEKTLTLVTCYPFYYVGAAPKRFIVRAELEPGLKAPAR
ncbi:MAG TPA: class D sortase [Bryobacteraceae bacterium]|jgi:sortase A|nr:class D sortase [Bryobacteraceae bacterium]